MELKLALSFVAVKGTGSLNRTFYGIETTTGRQAKEDIKGS